MTLTPVRGRFAPTPSGLMHIGNMRTALIAWLQVRSAGGQFVLRMEDIDKPRCRPELAEQALADLKWLGLDWDEGPDIGGPFPSYVQSERESLYRDALDKLEQEGRLYPCFCTRAELLMVASAPHGLNSEGPVYPGTCRLLSNEQREERSRDKTPSLRMASPGHDICFQDLAAGPQRFPADAVSDFVVKRADGIISYQLAVTIDDAAMRITDVLRGYDLLDSTPRQLLLYEALGLPAPRFTHIPLLMGQDGKRLAKRHGGMAIAAMRANGVHAEHLVGWIAAHSGLIDKPEPVRPHDLIQEFNLDRIPKDPVTVTDLMLQSLLG
ncbi:tRNA glutamyl-Q(34) synthetase GluQRS [Paenibacillus mendelii]|uniref:Glutamyl-Q tRNA(Asp) synthetase n=1 Tax=Paenibacillus mendelii TaxID=206163 RepID=A0ABV6JK56_9BACL|nr:tRNA glutamyl-Q(34) synthetase GluQRS [Paenibacillus mendelii]MCQ6557807.1 tRNA glutamyl-Q(34) synthetase GluQRS [Paenibacillus mendelii]